MLNDMTKGTPSKVLLSFAFPIILSGMFQQLYNIADSVIAGHFAGVDALAAVGASYPITMLFIAIATGAGVGCSVVISQLFGAGTLGKLKTAISTSILTIIGLSIALTLIGLLICNPLMRLMNTPEDIFADSALYLRIYICGLFFLFTYNIATAIFNGLGDSKTPLYFLIFSSLFNVILDLVFVAVFKMGVAGVALATFIAQGLSSIAALLYLIYKVKKIHTDEVSTRFDLEILAHISRIAVPSIIQQSIVSVGQLCVQALVNSYGATVVAGYSSAIKMDSFFKIVIMSMGNAVSNFTAQNLGAGKIERVPQGYRAALKVMFGYSMLSLLIVLLFSNQLIGIFVDSVSGSAVISIGSQYMYIVSAAYFAFALLMVGNGILRGAGYMKGFTTSTLTDLFVRVIGSYILAYLIGYEAIWISIPVGWIVGMGVCSVFYKKGSWKKPFIEKTS